MRSRSGRRPSLSSTTDAAGTPFGIGVPVHVLDPGEGHGGSFAGEPTGLIVGLAGTLPRSGVTVQSVQARVWTVAFDAPQHLRDGRGPFERADISEELLVAAPPIGQDDAPDQEDTPDHTREDGRENAGIQDGAPDEVSAPDDAGAPGEDSVPGQEAGGAEPGAAPSSDPGTTTPFS